jgi:hypothetical protein
MEVVDLTLLDSIRVARRIFGEGQAENPFLRKQLALFREREKKAMPTTPADRLYSPNWLVGSTGVVH